MRSVSLILPLLFGLSSCSLFSGDDPRGDRKDRGDDDDDDNNGDDDDDDDDDTTRGDDDDDNNTTPTNPGTSTTRDDPRAPEILSFALDSERITEGEELILSVIVTDPDGAGDILAGELLTLGGDSFGSFSAVSQGSFEISVSWSELNEMESIDINGVPIFRELVARFYDTAGHSAQLTFSTELYCEGTGAGCNGVCDVDIEHNPWGCGSCDNICDSAVCGGGNCAVVSDCSTDETQTCEEICNEQGLGSCVMSGYMYGYEDDILYYQLAAGVSAVDTCDAYYLDLYIPTCSDPISISFAYDNIASAACFCEG